MTHFTNFDTLRRYKNETCSLFHAGTDVYFGVNRNTYVINQNLATDYASFKTLIIRDQRTIKFCINSAIRAQYIYIEYANPKVELLEQLPTTNILVRKECKTPPSYTRSITKKNYITFTKK